MTPVRVDCIRRNAGPHWDFYGLAKLVKHLRQARYDLIHTHTSKAGMIGRLAGRLAGVPAIIHTVHGFAFHEQSRPAVVSLISTLERAAASWCDRIVTVSNFHRRWALELGIAEEAKIVAIPNGIEPVPAVQDDRRLEVRSALGVSDDTVLAIGLGRLAPQKGFADLIVAVSMLSDTVSAPYRVLIAGEGPSRNELEALIERLGVGDRIKLIGFQRDVSGIVGAADLIVQPSLWEGLSISLLEAMSASKAILTTTIESNLEVVGSSGCAVLVPPRNPRKLALEMARLISDDSTRIEMAEKALAVYREGYTVERMHDSYMALYDEVLAGSEGYRG